MDAFRLFELEGALPAHGHRAERDANGTAVSARFGYDLERRLDEIRPDYRFDISCQGSVPESIMAFLEANSVEDAIRNAISLGGDADTMACIAGGIAQAYFQTVPEEITAVVRQKLPAEFLEIVVEFNTRFGVTVIACCVLSLLD